MDRAILSQPQTPPPVDQTDIQGLVASGFPDLNDAVYLLLTIKDPEAARRWLNTAPLTTASQTLSPLSSALQVAFTAAGLEKIGATSAVMEGFSHEFLSGMAGDENRSRRLGDTGSNSPAKWSWGAGERTPHLVVMIFAKRGELDRREAEIRTERWNAAFQELERLSTSDLDGREPFGFIDGISQPKIDWKQARRISPNCDQIDYGNLVSLGEFVLGYANEYGRITERPVVSPREPGSDQLLPAADQPEMKDVGRNGTYVVMRQLRQDVRGLWQFLDRAAVGNSDLRYKLAEAFVGRRYEDGGPLVPLSEEEIEGIATSGDPEKRAADLRLNNFNYDGDRDGIRCPFGAHVRRGNPRNADIPGKPRGLFSRLFRTLGLCGRGFRYDLVSSTRFHRLLRRGREYGPELSPEDALGPAPAGEPERGLIFLSVGANIERQFEFVQNAWIMRTKFDGLTEESDALLGNREPVEGCPFTDTFSLPQENALRRRLTGVPQFVFVRGGAYFFMPGIRALKYLCTPGS